MSLEVKDLTISFAEGGAVTENISFQVKPGNMLSIVGGSGAGKTTICRAIMGLLGTTYKIKGGIFYNRTNLLEMSHTMLEQIYGKDICFIAQNPMTAFNPSIKLEKQLRKTYLQHQKRISKRDIRDILIDMLQRFGLEDGERILRGYPFEMSGGNAPKAHDNCCICGYICSSIIWNNLGGKLIFYTMEVRALTCAGFKAVVVFSDVLLHINKIQYIGLNILLCACAAMTVAVIVWGIISVCKSQTGVYGCAVVCVCTGIHFFIQ